MKQKWYVVKVDTPAMIDVEKFRRIEMFCQDKAGMIV